MNPYFTLMQVGVFVLCGLPMFAGVTALLVWGLVKLVQMVNKKQPPPD